MRHDDLDTLLCALPSVIASQPFGPEADVYKVCGKMFALIGVTHDPLWLTLKCDPELVDGLRDQYDAVVPGYHMNKRHWNTITLDGSVPDLELRGWIEHSYRRVLKGLKAADREALLAHIEGS